ncbi:RAM signaling pathway protein [Sodiomyces alkalinus F11]|uniref:RAM signaling pathway protein n=1 Tax=Sodiomyces alkalinus (strain CBS 110278 / VKM F-3762 / F11) TaxID=1314773 RepID=A0A3N2PPH9_SODAK|nr:RAM signaling pathway protein [Sodiomyces alkalinus F11]ROT36418.1 RAM signaling pathway protein [Sodiomyces alkalinus F11]
MDRLDRLDRPNGPSQHPNSRGLPDNPAQGVRRQLQIQAATSLANVNAGPPPPIPPLPSLRSASSNATLSAHQPLSSSQVIALARDAMKCALEENETQAAEASAVSTDLKPGVTIDLSRKGIQRLPEEVVDIIQNELERLALSHNQISSFPMRFAECTSLRYLNVRNNQFREFPLALCDLKSLEILDLSKNKLRVLPPDIVRLASLKVFSVQKNRIEELPLALADMVSLQVLKFDGNPLVFPPREVLQVQAGSPPNDEIMPKESETEVAVTAQIKRFLRQKVMAGRAESESADEMSETMETPRMAPVKRMTSGRFPIKVNGAEVPDIRSPATGRAPSIPSRSHYRGLSQQSSTGRRPGVMPLTIGNVNERVRSNSETLLQATRGERSESRARRMGAVSQKTPQLGTLDETQANVRFSHYRGLSHGSAMTGSPIHMANMAFKSPVSPADPYSQRPVYVRRLSILPERRRESKAFNPVLEAAKGILYAVFQIHPMIQMLMGLTGDGSAKRSSLEMIFYNTNSHVEELEQEIQRHDPSVAGDHVSGHDPSHNTENVRRACQTLVSAYIHICTLLTNNVDSFIDNGEPRYIRTLLVLIFNSIMEIRATLLAMPPEEDQSRPQPQPQPQSQSHSSGPSQAGINDTIRPYPRSHSNSVTLTAEADMNGPTPRVRGPGYLHNHNPGNLRVATDVTIPYINTNGGESRTATITSATPRSGESFVSSASAGRGGMLSDFTEDDRSFEKIFLVLQRSSDLVMRVLPLFQSQLANGARTAAGQRAPEDEIHCWKGLIAKCGRTVHQAELLKNRMSVIKLKEPGIMSQSSFRGRIRNFVNAWAEFATQIKGASSEVLLPLDTRARLRPIHQLMKETRDTILQSPWDSILSSNPGGGGWHSSSSSTNTFSPNGGQQPHHGMSMQMQMQMPMQMPMTPQSAALGPAVQATVPSTPQSASFAAAFSGNVFERADALISMGGLSMSQTNTMATTGGGGAPSFSSTSSFSSDGMMTPSSSSVASPSGGVGVGSGHHSHSRLHGSKAAF